MHHNLINILKKHMAAIDPLPQHTLCMLVKI